MSLLREIFGPSQKEVWNKLCNEIEADFVKGGFWERDKVIARVKEWTVTLDTYAVSTGKTSTVYTRMRAPYVNKDNLRFKIYRKGVFSELGKLFGMQDIETGFLNFDDDFIIKGNDEQKIKELLSNQKIRELIELQHEIFLQVKDDEGWFGTSFPEGVDELYFQVHGVVKDIDKLKSLYYLFAEVLNQLCIIGSAYQKDPNIYIE